MNIKEMRKTVKEISKMFDLSEYVFKPYKIRRGNWHVEIQNNSIANSFYSNHFKKILEKNMLFFVSMQDRILPIKDKYDDRKMITVSICAI